MTVTGWGVDLIYRCWQLNFFLKIFTSRSLGKISKFDLRIFLADGLVQPPTRKAMKPGQMIARWSVFWALQKVANLEGKWDPLSSGKSKGGEILYERLPKPPTFWNSYTRTLILDTIMKLSGTIGVTQKTMTFDTHVCLILLQTLNP